METILAGSLFLLAYFFIVTEKIPRAVAASLGGSLLILLGVLTQDEAIHHIDWNTLGLLTGMMIIVDLTRRSGVFTFLAIWSAKKVKGDPIKILLVLSLLTAVLSAFLDNVTTVLLMVPVVLAIADTLKVDPKPYLFTQIIISNIGGTSTMIGDPPNIMIAGPAGLSFMDFIVNLGPIVVVLVIVVLYIFYLMYRKKLVTTEEAKRELMEQNEWEHIKDWALLKKSVFVLGLTILGFVLHPYIHVETATIALAGAMLLMLIAKAEPEEVFLAIEWPTLFFFAGLFVLVGGLVEVGILDRMAQGIIGATEGDLLITALLILWLSAILSGFLDNIPFVATMIPLIQKLAEIGQLTPAQTEPLWWALALGACLGGNGTLIGASANVIVVGIAEKNGVKISYMEYFKIGFPIMLLTVAIATVYLVVRYF